MSWWVWTLLWIVLVGGAGLVVYLAVRRVLRRGMALVREFGAAADLLSEVTRAREAAPAGAPPSVEPAGATGRRHPSSTASSRRRRRGATRQDVR